MPDSIFPLLVFGFGIIGASIVLITEANVNLNTIWQTKKIQTFSTSKIRFMFFLIKAISQYEPCLHDLREKSDE